MIATSWFLLTAIALLSLLYWMYWRRTHRRMLQLASLVPGPPTVPIFGNALVFMAKPEEQLNIFAKMLSDYGQYVRIWLGPDLVVCVKNPSDIRFLLTSNKINQKGPLYEFMKTFIGSGILTGGPTWRNHRKIANPSYSKKSVHHYTEIFNREAEDLAEVLCKQDPNVPFDVYPLVVHATTQCVCQTLMGLSKEESNNVKCMNEVVAETQAMYTFIFEKMTRWWLQIPFIYNLTGRKTKENYYVKLVDQMTTDIVAKRRTDLKISPPIDEEYLSVVDRFVLSGDMTDKEVKWETFTMFTTSQEASAKIASACLVFLGHLPNWQEKVYREIEEVVVGRDAFVSDELMKKLPSLDMFYKETLRYMSIAAFIQRTVEDEITINDGKITLPAGTSVVIPIHEVHRDPQYWDEPLKFKPERFLPENAKKRNAYIPFSLGAMDCLGRVYATSLIKALIVKVLQRVELSADGVLEDLELQVAISVKLARGYMLRARPRLSTPGRPSFTI